MTSNSVLFWKVGVKIFRTIDETEYKSYTKCTFLRCLWIRRLLLNEGWKQLKKILKKIKSAH